MLPWLMIACSPSAREAPSPPCASCHAEEVARWEGSHHALAEAPLQPEDDWARTLGGVRRIGVDPLVQVLVPAEGGRLQAHVRAWDPARRELFDTTEPREPDEWGHWSGGGMTWNSQCASCHNTGVEKRWDKGSYSTSVAEMGVTCAACHGVQETHTEGGPAPLNARMEDTCLGCHTRRAELTGAFQPGDRYFDHFVPTFLDDPVFRADGRALGEVFASNFFGSAMHAVGCGACHDPHSGGLRLEGDALCNRCHETLGPQPHSEHTDVACVACHMPKVTVMGRHARRDHSFTTPARGVTPDPCADCHPSHPATAEPNPQSVAFERARSGSGWKDLPWEATVPPARRAGWVSSLRAYPEAQDVVRAALESDETWVRVAAANALVPRSGLDRVALEKASQDPVRAVRVGAQRALSGLGAPAGEDYRRMLDHNADHPVMGAERGLVRLRAGDPGGLADLDRAVKADVHNGSLVVLRARGLSILGRLTEASDALGEAQDRFPTNPEVQAAAGLAHAAAGRSSRAMDALTQAVGLRPEDARSWRNLALLHHGAGDTRSRDTALERALALSPDPELRAWAASLKD